MTQREVEIHSGQCVIIYLVEVDGGGTKTGVYEETPGKPAIYGTHESAVLAQGRLHRFAQNVNIEIASWVMRRAQ